MKAFVAALFCAVTVMVPNAPVQADPFSTQFAPGTGRHEWDLHRFDAWQPDPAEPWRRGVVIDEARSLVGPSDAPMMVFGYLPSWKIGAVTLHLDILSHIGYFSVDVGADGSLGDARHWGTPTLATLVAQAHAEGVRVVLVATNFSETSQAALLGSPTARAAAVANLVDLVVAGEGDGVNIDFERLPAGSKANFVTFVSEVKAAMDAALGDSSVTVATPAVDWDGAYDYDRLAEECDGLIIMGYDYHYAGGNPGPVSPLAGSTKWGQKSITWTLDDYDRYGGVANRGKFSLALPLYGYDWPATAGALPSSATGAGDAVTYYACQTAGASNGRRWDDDSSSPWYEYYTEGAYHQVWCDTDESLVMKYLLAKERGLGGIAFWALGYEAEYVEPWQQLVTVFGSWTVEPPDVVEVADVADDVVAEYVEQPPFDVVTDVTDARDATLAGDVTDAIDPVDVDRDTVVGFDAGAEATVSQDLAAAPDDGGSSDGVPILDSRDFSDTTGLPESNSSSGCSIAGMRRPDARAPGEDYPCALLILALCGLILSARRCPRRVR